MTLVKRLRPGVQEVQDFAMKKARELLMRDGYVEHIFLIIFGNDEGRVGVPAILSHHQFEVSHPRDAMPVIATAIREWNKMADIGKKEREIIGLVTLGEAWVSRRSTMEEIKKVKYPSEDPDREEVIMSYASDRDGYGRMAMADIRRTKKGKITGLGETITQEQQMTTVFNPWGGPHRA